MQVARVVRSSWGCVACLCALLGCERSPQMTVSMVHDAALAPVVLTPPPEPAGITAFDCTGTGPGQSAESLRTWKSKGAAGAAVNLKGHPLACDITLRSDCAGQAELRVSAGLARSEKVVTAVAPGKAAMVKLRLASGPWEKALEPEDRAPFHDTLQLVARAEVRCAEAVKEARPRYWTDSFIAGLMGERAKVPPAEPAEPEVAMRDAPASNEGAGERAREPATTTLKAKSEASATNASERAAARAARRERRKKAGSQLDLNLNPPGQAPAVTNEEPASEE